MKNKRWGKCKWHVLLMLGPSSNSKKYPISYSDCLVLRSNSTFILKENTFPTVSLTSVHSYVLPRSPSMKNWINVCVEICPNIDRFLKNWIWCHHEKIIINYIPLWKTDRLTWFCVFNSFKILDSKSKPLVNLNSKSSY